MELKDIVSISGRGGLYKFISEGRNGIIVESFLDNKRTFVSASTKVSSLGEIAIFSEDEETPLLDVFYTMIEKHEGKESINSKSSNQDLKKYMEEILPVYDKERVYVSDIKKIVNWYNILIHHDLKEILDETKKKQEEQEKEEKERLEKEKQEKVKSTEESKNTEAKKTTKDKEDKTTKNPDEKQEKN